MTFGELINDLMNMKNLNLMNHEVKNYSVGTSNTNGGVHIDISLGDIVCKKEVKVQPEEEDIPVKRTLYPCRADSVKVEREDLGSYLSKFKGATVVADKGQLKTLSEIKEKTKHDISGSSVAVVSNARPTKRYVYFKSQEEAKAFASEWEGDFEAHEKKNGAISKYTISRNTKDNDLFKKGYLWVLSFRMGGKTFEAMDSLLPELKKKENKHRGGACMRCYK